MREGEARMKLHTAMLVTAASSVLGALICFAPSARSADYDPIKEQNDQNAAHTNSVDHPYKPTQYYQENAVSRRQPPKHLVYVAEPGGTANGMLPYPNGGTGIVVLDADHNYQFLKRITW